MTNFEKYKDEVLSILTRDKHFPAMTHNKLVSCVGLYCSECKFLHSNCASKFIEWLYEEYKEPEPEIDWSKVAVDTPILVRDNEEVDWSERHFAKYENWEVYAWRFGRTSWTTSGPFSEPAMISWRYAKLAKDSNV